MGIYNGRHACIYVTVGTRNKTRYENRNETHGDRRRVPATSTTTAREPSLVARVPIHTTLT